MRKMERVQSDCCSIVIQVRNGSLDRVIIVKVKRIRCICDVFWRQN